MEGGRGREGGEGGREGGGREGGSGRRRRDGEGGWALFGDLLQAGSTIQM